jgi:signal transduction histidine kinase
MMRGHSLRRSGLLIMFAAFVAGMGTAGAWFWSERAWQNHLNRSFLQGITIYEALRTGSPAPAGIAIKPLPNNERILAEDGEFARIPSAPRPSFVTNLSIFTGAGDPVSGQVVSIGIVSDSLHYAVSQLPTQEAQPTAQKFANVTRLLATYCSETILYASLGDGRWWQIDGNNAWGCSQTPNDLRLFAVIAAGVILAVIGTFISDTSSYFDHFANALRTRRRLGGPASYSASGPKELRDIVLAVNSYLRAEREQLAQRALILSGVSHDLGTPATRLRLRCALIEDQSLRTKMEGDIDSMTGMIESALIYTRAELSAEEPRQMSLSSLVEAIVDDYRDMGSPVTLLTQQNHPVAGGRSVFSAHSGQGTLSYTQSVLATVRPISMGRAISNLIDNALKYGRRAVVELVATADTAVIVIEDAGSGMSVREMEDVIAPFKRGANTSTTQGSGLGLTIVAAVAMQHGGRLYFENGATGLRACLEISRV